MIALAKAGLVMQLKDAIGPKFIMERQKEIWDMARAKWENLIDSSIKILGNSNSTEGGGSGGLAKMAVIAFTTFNMESGRTMRAHCMPMYSYVHTVRVHCTGFGNLYDLNSN